MADITNLKEQWRMRWDRCYSAFYGSMQRGGITYRGLIIGKGIDKRGRRYPAEAEVGLNSLTKKIRENFFILPYTPLPPLSTDAIGWGKEFQALRSELPGIVSTLGIADKGIVEAMDSWYNKYFANP